MRRAALRTIRAIEDLNIEALVIIIQTRQSKQIKIISDDYERDKSKKRCASGGGGGC